MARPVNGSARVVGWVSRVLRSLQTGYLYHYAFATIIGLVGAARVAAAANLNHARSTGPS